VLPVGPVGPIPEEGGAFEMSPVVELTYTTSSPTPLGMFPKFIILELLAEELFPDVLLPTLKAPNAPSLGIKPNDIF
jgi:hypothetical protein